jgi:hypothetical protein
MPGPRRAAPALAAVVCLVAGCDRSVGGREPLARAGERLWKGARLPGLTATRGGDVVLTYVQELRSIRSGESEVGLSLARFRGASLEPLGTAASGTNWFVNWADTPKLAAVGDSRWLVCVLERTGTGSYDYGVRLRVWNSLSNECTEPVWLHDHAGPGEHGFVSLVEREGGGAAAVWLDGRASGSSEHEHGAGAMQLRARVVSASGALGREELLDERVCDCCPTAALAAGGGRVLVAYRDRTQAELRDIALLAWIQGARPKPLWNSADGWRVDGCPVNGPALAGDGARTAVVYFTQAAGGPPSVRAAFGDELGERFGPTLTVGAEGELGRVSAAFDGLGRLWVSRLVQRGQLAAWVLCQVDPERGALAERELARVSPLRASGLGQLAYAGDRLLFAFTETEGQAGVRVLELWPATAGS